MSLASPQFLPSTEDAPRGFVVKTTSTVYRGAMIARYTAAAGGDQGYCDNVGASANMSCVGVSEQNGGAQPSGHTLTMSAEVRALEMIIPITFTGPALTTAMRGQLVYGIDENTGNVTAGSGIPVGELVEVISSTRGKVGVGPSFIARAAAAAAAALTTASPFQVDEWTDPAAPSTTALKAATATTVAPQTILVAAMSAPGIAALLAYPRNVTFTTAGATATHAPDTATITGTDIDGNVLTESIAGLAGGAATYQGVKAFKTIVSIVYGAASDVDATIALGIGKKFGLSQSIKQRAGIPHAMQEIANGAVVNLTGTFVSAATSPPHGTYAPSADPDAAKDYSLTYEHS